MAKKKRRSNKEEDGPAPLPPRRYGVAAYGYYGGPHWGPYGWGQTATNPPLSEEQFGDVGAGGDGGGDGGSA